MKIKAVFEVNASIYELLKKETEDDYLNYECNFGSSMWKNEENPNHYQQETVGGNKWDMIFLQNNKIEVHFEGRRNSAINGNSLRWNFYSYEPGNYKPVDFRWNLWDNSNNYDFVFRGEVIEYETSAKWAGKPFGFEVKHDVWGRTEDGVVALKRTYIFDQEKNETRLASDEEVKDNSIGYHNYEIVGSDEMLVFIKKK